ncbi:MAG: hypothetical protein AAFO94_17535 [Bacteroidota bacterium]
MQDKIMTLHPDQSKTGVNIDHSKYLQMKSTLCDILETHGAMTFSELQAHTRDTLRGKFDGSIGWYMTTVKLDLEARALIKVNRKRSPMKIELA